MDNTQVSRWPEYIRQIAQEIETLRTTISGLSITDLLVSDTQTLLEVGNHLADAAFEMVFVSCEEGAAEIINITKGRHGQVKFLVAEPLDHLVPTGDVSFASGGNIELDTSPINAADNRIITLINNGGDPDIGANGTWSLFDLSAFSSSGPSMYTPDWTIEDQGDTDRGSAAYWIDEIGDTERATILFRHSSGAATTTYTFDTDVTFPSNVTVKFARGAIISPDSGVTVTFEGDIDAGLYQIFSGAGDVSHSKISVEWFGPDSSAMTSQLSLLQKAFDAAGENSYITINESYWIDGTENAIFQSYGGIILYSGQRIEFKNQGELKVIATSAHAYSCFQGYNLDNVTLINPVLTGDRDSHTGATGEYGHGIFFITSYNIAVQGGNIKDMWGDGITIQAFAAGTDNADAMPADFVPGRSEDWIISGVLIENCRRQGISVIGCENFTISDNIIKDIAGTAPESGIDCEPNNVDTTNLNGNITGNVIESCIIGVMTTSHNNTINISGNTVNGSRRSFQIQGENIAVIGNTVYAGTDGSASSANGVYSIGSGNHSFMNNYVYLNSPATDDYNKLFGDHGSTPTNVIIKGNIFIVGGYMFSNVVPTVIAGIMANNTFIVEEGSDISETTSNISILFNSNWFVDNNTVIDQRIAGSGLRFFDCLGGGTFLGKGFNNYIGYSFNLTAANNDDILNIKTKTYKSTSQGVKSEEPHDVTFDISADFEDLQDIRVQVAGIGNEQSEQNAEDASVHLKSVSDTSVTVECRNSGASYQTVTVYLTVSGEGRSS